MLLLRRATGQLRRRMDSESTACSLRVDPERGADGCAEESISTPQRSICIDHIRQYVNRATGSDLHAIMPRFTNKDPSRSINPRERCCMHTLHDYALRLGPPAEVLLPALLSIAVTQRDLSMKR